MKKNKYLIKIVSKIMERIEIDYSDSKKCSIQCRFLNDYSECELFDKFIDEDTMKRCKDCNLFKK